MPGVQMFPGETESLRLQRAKQAGSSWVRLPIQWRWIEPLDLGPPHYNWGGFETAIQSLANADLEIVGTLYTKPSWAASSDCGPVDRVPIERFGLYVRNLVERYDADGFQDAPGSPRIDFWEIESEADFDPAAAEGEAGHGSCFGKQGAEAYGELLREAYMSAKAADETAVLLFAGLSYERFYNSPGVSPGGPFDYYFTRRVLTHLHDRYGDEPAWPFFDIMGMHFYDDFRDQWGSYGDVYERGLRAKLTDFRDNQLVLAGRYDLRSVPFALTEMGLPSGPADAWTDRSEDIQALYPARIFARSTASGVEMLSWFLIADRLYGDCANPGAWSTFGLSRALDVGEKSKACPISPLPGYRPRSDAEPKPVMTAYRTVLEQLDGHVFDAALGPDITGDRRVEAYRFRHLETGRYTLVAFADHAARLGKRNQPTLNLSLKVDADWLPDWTGEVERVDHLGGVDQLSGGAGFRNLLLGEPPVFLRAVP